MRYTDPRILVVGHTYRIAIRGEVFETTGTYLGARRINDRDIEFLFQGETLVFGLRADDFESFDRIAERGDR